MEPSRIPNRLKKYRRLAGLSQKEVAHLFGLQHTSCISRWEKGIGLPGIPYLFRLSILYKTQPTHLYFDLWQEIKKEVIAKEKLLSADQEPIISNEQYFI